MQVGNREKDNSGISRLFLETHSRMPSLQESSGPFSPLMSGRKSLQEQKGAYVPHSHKLTFLFPLSTCYFLSRFLYSLFMIVIYLFIFPLFSFLYFLLCYFFFLYLIFSSFSSLCLIFRYIFFLYFLLYYFIFFYLPLFFPLFLSQSLSFPSSVRDFILETGSARQKFNSNQRT